MSQPMCECPSFNVCSAPKCPLDPNIDLRSRRLPDEDKCKAQKPTRLKIGKKYLQLLPYKGLTKKEWAGIKSWHTLTDVQRKKIVEQGANRLKSINLTKNKRV